MQIMISLKSFVSLRTVIAVTLLVPTLVAGGEAAPMDVVKNGEKVFATHCSFCHGNAGSGNNAPKLADRGLDGQHIEKLIAEGVTGTAMAAWGKILSAPDYEGVVAYVKGLNGIAASGSASSAPVLSAEAARGRDLFRDATRGLGACSNCHAVDDRGIAVAPPMKNIPSKAALLRMLATPQVNTATVDGEVFPAIVVAQSPDETRVYDFTTVPPVLRTFATPAVKVTDGSKWRHAAVVGTTYSDQELELVLDYLRAVYRPQKFDPGIESGQLP